MKATNYNHQILHMANAHAMRHGLIERQNAYNLQPDGNTKLPNCYRNKNSEKEKQSTPKWIILHI